MAKISRIDQGNRPSAVGGMPQVDTSAGDIFGGLGAVAKAGFEVAVSREAAEQKRWAEAMAEKQRIINSTRAGSAEIQFNEMARQAQDAAYEQYADKPEDAIGAIHESTEKIRLEVMKSLEGQPEVQLQFTRAAQNSRDNMVKEAHVWAEARRTQQAKDRIVGYAQAQANAAWRNKGNSAWVKTTFEDIDANKNIDAIYGKGAAEFRKKTKNDVLHRWAQATSEAMPFTMRQLMDSKGNFLEQGLTSDQFKEVREKTAKDAEKIGDNMRFNRIVHYSGKDSELSRMLESGADVGAEITTDRMAADDAEIAAIDANRQLTPKQKAAQKADILAHKEFLSAIANVNYINAKDDVGTDADSPKLWEKMREFGSLSADKRNPQRPLSILNEVRRQAVISRGAGKLTKGTFDAIIKEVDLQTPSAVAYERGDTGGFWSRNTTKQNAVKNMMDRFDKINKGAFSGVVNEELRDKATTTFTTLWTAAERAKGMALTQAEMNAAADEAYFTTIGVPNPTGRK